MGSLYSASPYVPIDYAIPMARMEKTVENLHPTAIITDTDGKTKLESLNLDTEILIFDELADGQANDAAAGSIYRPSYWMLRSDIMYGNRYTYEGDFPNLFHLSNILK